MKKYFLIIVILCGLLFCSCDSYSYGELSIDQSDVAILSIFSDDGSKDSSLLIRNYGHAFLSLTNISSSNFFVGGREVSPGETITIGLWNILEHFGVWFNVDGNYISEYNKYPNRVSLSIGITDDDINTINKVIDENDKWDIFFNCSAFAITCWNSVASSGEKINERFLLSPRYLTKEISKFEGVKYAKEVKTTNTINYYKEG